MSARHPATSGHGRSAATACSALWDEDGTSAFGTAAVARFFVALEQPGPWGRQAATESHLDPSLGAELDRRCSALGGRFSLVRRPSAHADHSGPHRVLLAHGGARPSDAWLLIAELVRVEDLLSLDWVALARGHRDLTLGSVQGSSAAAAQPALLVCTNGRRDVCCAVRGRPLAGAAAALAPERVWEVSHTGGHRFAPTAVLLPWGQTYARMGLDCAERVLSASLTGHTPRELLGPIHDRGRSALSAPAQAAEAFVRHTIGETHLPSLWAEDAHRAGQWISGSPNGSVPVQVRHVDGRTWRTRVTRSSSGQVQPESCGKAPIPVYEHHVTILTAP